MGSAERNSLRIKEERNVDETLGVNHEPIAVIGMSCEFANGINTPDSLFNVLQNSIDVGSEIPSERFDMDSYAPLYTTKKSYIRRGYFLHDDRLHHFDPAFFGITDGDALSMDPCHRILLEKFLHLLEDANYPIEKIKGTRTAVFIGQFTNEHLITFFRSKVENETNYLGANLGLYNASARISYHFDLHGPNLTLDTACSSSLQTVHLAIQSLRTGEADYAVAGASNLCYTPETFFTSLNIGAISPDGRSRSYSDDANGYAKGEGVGLVLFKRLTDAIRDNDRIYCVIRDIMVSHDGHEQKKGYNVPSSYGQNLLLKQIYSRNRIDLNDVFYIEGHGTGTKVGDPIEANTLGQFFQRPSDQPPLHIGSVKSVLGHTEGTAGIASLIKVILCMKYRMIPPNMNFTRLNPEIRLNEYNLNIVTHAIPFPNRSITIGINNFGFGGNNAHAIVTEWFEDHSKYQSPSLPISSENSMEKQQYFTLTFSTKCQESLRNQIKQFSTWFSSIRQEISSSFERMFLSNLCEKLFLKRTTNFSHRLSLIFSTRAQLEDQIQSYLTDEMPIPGVIVPQEKYSSHHQSNIDICFIYSGQGPQWWSMGRQLYHSEPIFRQWIEQLNREFLFISNNSFSLIKELFETEREEDSNINFTNIAQPCILAIQIALTGLWLSWGIIPKRIIGHSVGEIAAAFIAGRLTLNQAVQIIYHRSRVQNYNTNQGGRMLALFLSETEAKELISSVEDRVQIAAINSPNSVTLSGDKTVLEKIFDDLSKNRPKVFKSWLRIENAFHSYQMERFNIREELIQSLNDLQGDHRSNEFDPRCSQAILYSTVTGTRSDQLKFNAEYWWKNIRNPVLFLHGIQSIFNDMKQFNVIPLFIEISPNPVLTATIEECYQLFQRTYPSSLIQSPLAIGSLERKKTDEQQTILSSAFSLFSYFGSNFFDLHRFFRSRIYSTISIPTSITSLVDQLPHYVFNHQIYWYESKDSVFSRRALKKKHHPLLGYRLWSDQCPTPTWKNILNIQNDSTNYSYLRDHRIHGDTLFPASAFIELIFTAINQILQHESSEKPSIILQNIQFLRGLYLDTEDFIHIETIITMPLKEFFIYSRRKSPNDSVQRSGLNGNDITINYTNEDSLHKYSSKEWSLHCRGSINVNINATLITSMYNIPEILNHLLPSNNPDVTILADGDKENQIENLYRYFADCGLAFGSKFRSINKLYRYKYEALSEMIIPSTLDRDDQYLCHPAVLDGCFQGMISIVPGDFYDTFVPISIDEIIFHDRQTSLTSLIEQSNSKLFANQILKPSIKGLTPEKTFQSDIVIFHRTNNQSSSSIIPVMIFRGFQIQNYPKENISKSITQKFQESQSIYHNNPKKIVPIPQLIEQFCAHQTWKLTDSSPSIDPKQFWIIFADHRFQIGQRLAEMLNNQHENILLIYHKSNPQLNNSLESMIIDDLSTIPSIIQSKFNQTNLKINIIFNWSIDLPVLTNPDHFIYQSQEQIACGTLMNIIQSIYSIPFDQHPHIFIITDHAQPMNVSHIHQERFNLVQSPIIGFGRSIINEYKSNQMKLIDLQFSRLSDELLRMLIEELNSFQYEEVVLRSDDQVMEKYIPKYSTIESNFQLVKMEIIPKLDIDRVHFQLEIPKSREKSDLQWVYDQISADELSPTDVEIEIHCVGLTFRDMLKVRGLHPYIRGHDDEHDRDENLGADFSGIIIRKGSQTKLNLHDRVFGVIANGSALKSHLICHEENLVRAPMNFTMEELATLQTYLTVLYSLENRIQLTKNQTILIHAATSGVGLAFIEYAQMVGAKIIVTAGTEEKRRFLRENYRIECVFNSRDLSFVSEVRRVAPNGHVDVIINSLSEIFLEKSLELLAPFGHFIELGKRDIYSKSTCSLFPMRLNGTFHVIDLVSVQKFAPKIIENLLERIANLCAENRLRPIRPIQSFDASQIQQAFSQYSQATHWGKFVVKIAESNEKLPIEISQSDERIHQIRKSNVFPHIVCHHGSIVISGGLGGLALQLSKWMIQHCRVKRIILLSRKDSHQLDPNTSQYLNWIDLQHLAEDNHAVVQVIKTNINDYDQVFSALRSINENTSYPIRGIIHSAMILRDGLVKNMSQEMLAEVMQPKIRGAWNLHYATVKLACPLEFFIMFSSIRNHIPGTGQSNYNAGNHFLDSLAYYRLNSLKLPAISMGLPAISGAGYLHNNAQQTVDLMEKQGVYLMPFQNVFQMIEQLQYLQRQAREKTDLYNPVIFAVNWKQLSATNLSSKLTQFAKEMLEKNKDNDESMISSNENHQISFDINTTIDKIRFAVSKIFGALNIDRIDVHRSLVQQGMDSLRAVQLRGWLLKEMFFDASLVELVQGMSIHDLGKLIQTKFNEKQSKTSTTILTSHNPTEDECSLLEQLHHSDSKYSLFCLHDIIGLSQTFIQFAVQMKEIYGNHCPSIYAFRASGYQSNEIFLRAVPIIAQRYISQMQQIQPHGPYHLVGYSFGGILAYEITRQLFTEHHSTVQSLILIDPPIPMEESPLEYDSEQFWTLKTIGLIQSYFDRQINPDQIIQNILQSTLSNEQRQQEIDQLMRSTLTILNERFSQLTENHQEMSMKIFEVIKAQTIAKENYTMNLAKASKESIRIDKAILFLLKHNNQYTSSEIKRRVWSSLLPQINIEHIDGTHHTLLEMPTVRLIINQLKQINVL